MLSRALLGSLLASTASAISLPPLIPSIPGVTEPLSENAPPLPILQVPTPPLESPPHSVNSQIRPKKIGYFWTAAGDNKHKDFLATYSLDDETFGTLIAITDVPSSGNSPHHLGPSIDGKTLVGGGLLSLLKTQVSMSNPQCNHALIPRRTRHTTSTPRTHTSPSLRSQTVLYSPPSPMRFEPNLMAAFSSPTWAPPSVLLPAASLRLMPSSTSSTSGPKMCRQPSTSSASSSLLMACPSTSRTTSS